MFYTIYKVTNKLNGKYYIGKHQTKDLQDGYMGSGKLIKSAIKKYGTENFTKEILHVFDTEEEMNAKEAELVVVSEETYNLCEGGKGGWGYLNQTFWSDPIKQTERAKKANINKKVPYEESSRRLKLAWSRGNRKHLIPSFAGQKHTQETKQKLSVAHKGKHLGSKNSQYGTCWITNGTENKKIKKDDLDNWISLGYYKGRI